MISLIGDSHASVLSQALDGIILEAGSSSDAGPSRLSAGMIAAGHELHDDFYTIVDGTARLSNRVGRRFKRVTGFKPIMRKRRVLLGLSMGCHASVMVRQGFWRQFTLLTHENYSAKSFVTSATFRRLVLHENRHVLNFIRLLKEADVDFFVVVSPPIRQRMIDRQSKHASAEELIEVHSTYQDVMVGQYRNLGAEVLLPPSECVDGRILRREFDSLNEMDVHHANVDYGRRVWRQIAARFPKLVRLP